MADDTPLTRAHFDNAIQILANTLENLANTLENRMQGLESAIEAQKTQLIEYIDERTHDVETRLLRAFTNYQQAETT